MSTSTTRACLKFHMLCQVGVSCQSLAAIPMTTPCHSHLYCSPLRYDNTNYTDSGLSVVTIIFVLFSAIYFCKKTGISGRTAHLDPAMCIIYCKSPIILDIAITEHLLCLPWRRSRAVPSQRGENEQRLRGAHGRIRPQLEATGGRTEATRCPSPFA